MASPTTTPSLIIITGPTGSGKTSLALQLAERLGCHILSADSRQLYKEIPIGTAAPSPEELQRVPHHFIHTLTLDQYYSAALYEEQVLNLLPKLWQQSPLQIMCGGSMMYIDAVCNGIDILPTITPQFRQQAMDIYTQGGLQALQQTLHNIDPVYYNQVDLNNHKRLIHAIEITLQAGVPYSSLRTGTIKQRPFRIIKLAINHDRETLFNRINTRVDLMVQQGLIQEAHNVYHLRHLNSLNTVGYKELFAHFDGTMDLPTAIARIAKNTRVYAKKQLTWMKRDPQIHLLDPQSPLLQQALDLI